MNAVVGIEPIGNAEAEAALCGALMLTNSLIDQIADKLDAEDFSDPWLGNLYALIVKERSRGRSPNPVTLKPYFDAEGYSTLCGLTGSGATAIAAVDATEQIKELAKRRRLLEGLSEALSAPRGATSDEIAAVAEAALAQIHAASSEAKEISAADAITVHLSAVEQGLPQGIVSGIESLDLAMGPIRPGDLAREPGRPGMGKSILGMSIAKGAALDGHGVLFISLEMKAEQLGMRLAADLCFNGHSGINFGNIERGELTNEQFRLVCRARDAIANLPLQISVHPSLRIGHLNAIIRRWKRRMAANGHSLGLVVVDYLQLMDADRANDSRVNEITQISRGLKTAALANDVGMVAIAQLSRKVEEREEKRPKLSDLRDSGSIEQDADGVLFLYRQEYYLKQTEPPEGHDRREKWEAAMEKCHGDIEFICAKRRQGETGIRHGRFFGCFQAVR